MKGSVVAGSLIIMSQEHETAAMTGPSAPIRYDEKDPATATKIMDHHPFHRLSTENDETQYPGTTITTTATASYSPTIADMDLFLNSSNSIGCSGDNQDLTASSSTSLHPYAVSPRFASPENLFVGSSALHTATTTRMTPVGGRGRGRGRRGQQQPPSAYHSLTYSDYDRLPYKANLRFQGDLNSMMQNWAPFEMKRQRRLVRFWGRQQSNDILCSFAAINQVEQSDQATMTVVSCIYWREAGEYFITSVDCIHLLENLLGAHFTSEEKNRVRRNFEEFRPQTISRLRPESAAFFRLVMDFPSPKPRTIEKDLKVFAWRYLGSALRKIVGKYQPSYSSTASINLSGLAASSVKDQPTPSS